MNGSNQQSGGWAIPAIFVLIWMYPGVAAVLALVVLAVKAPKVTGALIFVISVCAFAQFLTESDTSSSDAESFLIPVGFVFLLFIAAGCGLFAWGLRGGLAAATALPSLPNVPLPTLPQASNAGSQPARGTETSAGEPGYQSDEEKMHAALEEAKAIAGRMRGGHEDRKRVFERVFRHRCQQRGVTVSRVVWKRCDHSRVGCETETETENEGAKL